MRKRRREEMTEGGRRIRGERKGWRNGERESVTEVWGTRGTGRKWGRREEQAEKVREGRR